MVAADLFLVSLRGAYQSGEQAMGVADVPRELPEERPCSREDSLEAQNQTERGDGEE